MYQNTSISKPEKDFKAAMDDTIGCILFSEDYFYSFADKERTLISPLFVNEFNIAKQLKQKSLFDLLDTYIRILSVYNRFSHINYLVNVFKCSEIVDQELILRMQQNGGRRILWNSFQFDLSKTDDCMQLFHSLACSPKEDFGIVELQGTKVLILGTFYPNANMYVQMLRQNPCLLQDKLKNKQSLFEIERLIRISQILSYEGMVPISAKTKNRHITNLFLRLKSLLEEVDQIIMVFRDAGGVCIEFGQICENKNFAKKATVFVSKKLLESDSNYSLTSYATQGAFQLEYPRIFWFSTEEDLFEQVVEQCKRFNKS